MDDLTDVAVFVSIGKAGGLAAAEAASGLPRSTLSRRLARLEKRLGVQLAKRSPQGFALTPVGVEVFERYAAATAMIEGAEAAARDSRAKASGTIRVTAPTPIAYAFLLRQIPRFLQANAGVFVWLDVENRKVDLLTGSFDLAIRVDDVIDETLSARRLFQESDGLYASPAYLAARGRPGGVGEMDGHVGVLCRRSATPLRQVVWRVTDGDATVDIAIPASLQVDDPFAALVAAEAGAGLCCLPHFMVDDAVAHGALERVMPGWASPPKTVRAVLPHRPSKAARALLDFLAASAKTIGR